MADMNPVDYIFNQENEERPTSTRERVTFNDEAILNELQNDNKARNINKYSTKLDWKSQGFGDSINGVSEDKVSSTKNYLSRCSKHRLMTNRREKRSARLESPYTKSEKNRSYKFADDFDEITKFSISISEPESHGS